MQRRVLIVHQVGYRGGAGTMLANMIAAVDRQRYELAVVCPPGDMTADFTRLGARVLDPPGPIPQLPHYTGNSYWFGDPRFIAAGAAIFRSYRLWRDFFQGQRADVIQLDAMTLAPMIYACRGGGARVLCVVQETAVRGMLNLRTAWFRHLLSKMDGVMFISQYDRDQARCRAPIVEVIPNWVEVGSPPGPTDVLEARKGLGLPTDAKVVLMMGGISFLKGTLTLVEAAAELRDIENLVVCIAGYQGVPQAPRSPLRAALRRLIPSATAVERRVFDCIRQNRLEARVRLLGMRSDVAPLYLAADVVVFPATRPHQARPVLEAGAVAKPVIVSDFPNIVEFVANDANGLLFRAGDPGALAGQLRRVLSDCGLAQRLGLCNMEMTQRRHCAKTNGRRYASLLDRLAEHGRGE